MIKNLYLIISLFLLTSCLVVKNDHASLGNVRVGDEFVVKEQCYVCSNEQAQKIVCIVNEGHVLTIQKIETREGFTPMTGFGQGLSIIAQPQSCNYLFSCEYLISSSDGIIEVNDEFLANQ